MSRVFFTDRDLGKQFPEILRSAGLTVEHHTEEHHTDHFAATCPDDEWLRAVGERGWIAITHDRRIRYKPNELEAVMMHRVAVLLVVGRARYPDLARSFVTTLPRIERFLARHEPPFIAKVYRPSPSHVTRSSPGPVELWYPRQEYGARR